MNQQLIEQYVAGKLDGAQAEAFEEYCLMNPEFARQVEFEQRLKVGIAQVARGSTAEFVRNESSGFWKLAVAASIVLCVTASVWVWQGAPAVAGTQVLTAASLPQRDGTSMRLALIRSADGLPQLPRGVVRVEIAGLFETSQLYSVALDRMGHMQAALTIASLQAQRPVSPVALAVMIDSDQLDPGTYTLRVRGQGPGEESLDFSFEKP